MVMTSSISRVEVDGVSLAYAVHAAAEGPPLVFVHGYALRGTDGPYGQLLESLARRYTVYALDLPGHGASPAPQATWSIGSLGDAVAAFVRALGLERPDYVGHSLGGLVGLYAEIQHPGTFSGLCLLTPAPAVASGGSPEMAQLLIEQGRNRDAMRQVFRHMFIRTLDDVLEAVVDAVTVLEGDVHRQYLGKLAEVSIDSRLGEVAAPVLLVIGERDAVVSPTLQHDLARKLPSTKEVVFSAEGHMLPNEAPAVAAREILTFLDHDRSRIDLSSGATAGARGG